MASFGLNYLEIRVDGYKMLFGIRRPLPVITNSIGTWQEIYLITALVAVVTNSGILCFTLNAFNLSSTAGQVWAFYLFQNVLMATLFVVALVVDDVPIDVKIQLQRSKHLIDKCVLLIEDDVVDDEEVVKGLIESGKLTGHRN